jgi:hypothetical protein
LLGQALRFGGKLTSRHLLSNTYPSNYLSFLLQPKHILASDFNRIAHSQVVLECHTLSNPSLDCITFLHFDVSFAIKTKGFSAGEHF